jgi:hypothetical protein
VFLLDPWWNPASEAQAVDRAHRIGQAKQVMVYRLVAPDTIEEKVMALKARKGELVASILDAGLDAEAGCRGWLHVRVGWDRRRRRRGRPPHRRSAHRRRPARAARGLTVIVDAAR